MKCVVLGFGYLAQYLLPCIRRFTGGANTDLIGVKATTTGLDALRAKYAFQVQAGGAEQALLQLRPELIVISVKPNQVAALVEDSVAPYLNLLRAEGAPLPDIYAFAANPAVSFYTDALGSDVNVACMIPNMLSTIEGVSVAPVGVSFVSFDPRRNWPEDARRRALAFMEPTGTIVEIPPQVSADYVALNCACHIMFEFNYIAQAGLQAQGIKATLAETAQGFRTAFRDIFDDPSVRLVPCDETLWRGDVLGAMKLFMHSWYHGLMAYCAAAGVPRAAAHRNACGSMEVFQMEVQLETRAQIEETTRQHATPGGFLEKAVSTFAAEGMDRCAYIWRALTQGENVSDAVQTISDIARNVVAQTAQHGRSLA